METLKRILSALCLSALLISVSNASWLSSFLKNNFNASMTSESAGYYKTQASGFATGGSTRIRWSNAGTIAPFNIQPPRLNVGCNGIDFAFGSFSYLNFDQLVEKLKKMSSAAPAFAFQLALSTLCKDCQAILGELENIANAINSMNFDTCQMAMNLAKNVGEALNDGLFDGKETGWNQSLNKFATDTKNQLNSWASEINSGFKGLFPEDSPSNLKQTQGSLIKRVVDKMEEKGVIGGSFLQLFGSNEYKHIARALFGDFVGYKNEAGVAETTALIPEIPPQEFLKKIWKGDGKDSKITYSRFTGLDKCSANEGCKVSDIVADKNREELEVVNLREYYQAALEAVVNDIKAGSISSTNLETIEKAPLPVVDLLNLVATGEIDFDPTLNEYMSLELFRAYLEEFTSELDKGIAYVLNSTRVIQSADQSVEMTLNTFNQNKNFFITEIRKLMGVEANKINEKLSAIRYIGTDVKNAFQTNPMLKMSKNK